MVYNLNELRQFQVFKQVVLANSFTKAAQKLGISKAAVSKQVAQLEQQLGVKLIDRRTRHFKLTAVGQQCYQHCQRLLQEYEQLNQTAQNLRQQPQGEITVAAPRYFVKQYLTPKMQAFSEKYPEVKITIDVNEYHINYAADDIDIFFGYTLQAPPNYFVQKKLTDTRFILCAAPDYLNKHGTPTEPQQLAEHHYIGHSARKPYNITSLDKEREVYVEPVIRVNDTATMVELACQGNGIIKVYDYEVQQQLAQQQLIPILESYSKTPIPVYLYYREHDRLNILLRIFIDFFNK